jgi:DNA-binding HxlR family transcriptional regulator
MSYKDCANVNAANQHVCPVELTMKVLGGKWKMLILFHLNAGPKRFSELRKSINGITEKMLTQQLKELESDGVISRKVYPQVPPKVEYSLTEYGDTLAPVIKEMAKWGTVHKKRIISAKESGR